VIAVHSVSNMKHTSAHCEQNVELLNVKAQWPMYVPFDLTFGMCVLPTECIYAFYVMLRTVGNYFLVQH
jgi:hypothetical protein